MGPSVRLACRSSNGSLAGARTADYSHTRGSMQSGDAPSPILAGRCSPSPALDVTADRVSVLVSFVVVRVGSVTSAEGRVEHVADGGGRA
jgi:hypothetical protein